jgi:hypothetical protein
MKCICRTACQVRVQGGKIITFAEGQVYDFEEVPMHFESVESAELNFATATEAELLALKWSYKQIAAFAQEAYALDLPKGSKTELVKRLLDMRLRHVERA